MERQVSIIVPTQRRTTGLARAICSIFSQANVDLSTCELIVVDNDVWPSAAPLVQSLAANAPISIIYLHEPQPGVASARNAAVGAATGEFLAFLDDDEEAPPGWLVSLIGAQRKFNADVVFGPVRAQVPSEVRRHRAYFERFFSRRGPDEPGLLEKPFGCGDSFIRRAALPHPLRPFSEIRNHSGGEDDLLFAAMKARGARFCWAPAAWVWEHPDPSRLTLSYTLRRAFGYGQGPSAACAAKSPPDWLGVAGWMAQGVAQALVFGGVAAFQRLIGDTKFTASAERAVRGLGKTFWGEPFKLAYYGLPPGHSPVTVSTLHRRTRNGPTPSAVGPRRLLAEHQRRQGRGRRDEAHF